MRFKLTHRDLAMLTRYAIVGETYRASDNQCTIATGAEHIKFIKLYKTLTQCKQGMYVGGNSALKVFLLVCQLVQLQKQIS